MRHTTPIEVIVHYPKTAAGKAELSRRVGEVHADMANYKLQRMNIPAAQKLQLLDAVVDTVRTRQRTREY